MRIVIENRLPGTIINFFKCAIPVDLDTQIVLGNGFESERILKSCLNLYTAKIRSSPIVGMLRNFIKIYLINHRRNHLTNVTNQSPIDSKLAIREGLI